MLGVILGILVHCGAYFGHFGAVLGPKMEPKSTWGHLWAAMAPPGSPKWGSGGILGSILELIFDQKMRQKQE